jgi:hypothetical protein
MSTRPADRPAAVFAPCPDDRGDQEPGDDGITPVGVTTISRPLDRLEEPSVSPL